MTVTYPTYVGGLRDRLIQDSVYFTVQQSLAALGWFDPGRDHEPIGLVPEEQAFDVEIPLNTLAIYSDTARSEYEETGSQFSEFSTLYYVDFFAESDALGKHVIGDIRDILEGRFTSIGRVGPTIDVFDWTMATPVAIFYVIVDQVNIDRARNFPHAWLRHWWSIQFRVLDYYDTDADVIGLGSVVEVGGVELAEGGESQAETATDHFGDTETARATETAALGAANTDAGVSTELGTEANALLLTSPTQTTSPNLLTTGGS